MPDGSFFGALLISKMADMIGRKPTVMLSPWTWVIGLTVQCAPNNCGTLVAGGVMSGISTEPACFSPSIGDHSPVIRG